MIFEHVGENRIKKYLVVIELRSFEVGSFEKKSVPMRHPGHPGGFCTSATMLDLPIYGEELGNESALSFICVA